MKTFPLLLLVALAPVLGAAEPDACCAAHATVTATPANTTISPLTAHSLYQSETVWTNDRGEAVRLAQFRGRPVVIAMFFTSCGYACPTLVSDMKRIREALPPVAREQTAFVLVSFDDTRDTPEALHAYRERMGLDDAWTLLHGGPDEVQELAMLLGVQYRRTPTGQFSHSNLITILNAGGEVAHRREGLQGEVARAAHAVELAAK